MKLRLVQFFAILSLVAGCSANHGRYALLSARPLPLKDITADKIAFGDVVFGESKCKTFFIFPIARCSLNEAIAQAQGRDDLLTDVSVTYDQVNLFPLWRTETWTVVGKSVRIRP